MEAINGIKIFEVSEDEYVAAATAEDAIRWCAETYGPHGNPLTREALKAEGYLFDGGPRELAQAELDRKLSDEDVPDVKFTFREALTEGTSCGVDDYPSFFASGNC